MGLQEDRGLGSELASIPQVTMGHVHQLPQQLTTPLSVYV